MNQIDYRSQKAQSAELKSYGQMLVTDHSASNDQAEKVAKQIGIAVPTKPSVNQKATYDRMSRLSGTEFAAAIAMLCITAGISTASIGIPRMQ